MITTQYLSKPVTSSMLLYPGHTMGEYPNSSAFAAIKSDGSVVTWGNSDYGGDSSKITNQINGTVDVVQVFSTGGAFAALRVDGSVITWGSLDYGGDSSNVAKLLDGTIDVVQIFSTSNFFNGYGAFAALRSDGSVITWGNPTYGGDSAIYQFDSAFTSSKNYSVTAALDGTIDVTQIFSNCGAFAALRTDGSVITWGEISYGGDSSSNAKELDGTQDVVQIFSTIFAFAALRADGSVVTWGDLNFGGYSGKVTNLIDGTIDVVQIFSTTNAFAALRADGSVATWGDVSNGGDLGVYHFSSAKGYVKDYSVAKNLDGTIDVVKIYSTVEAFAAIREDGSVVTWGDDRTGGSNANVISKLDGTIDVVQIFSSGSAFAALREDGSVVTWGQSGFGGNSSNVANKIDGTIDVVHIFSTAGAFAALREDGSVVTWGDPNYGGDSSSVVKKLDGIIDVVKVATIGNAFAAIRADGSVIIWGDSKSGANNVMNKLSSGVLAISDIEDSTNLVFNNSQTSVVNHLSTGSVNITGTAIKDQVLTASNTLADIDGLGAISYTWLKNDEVIPNATQSTYKLTQADTGQNISVKASYLDLQNTPESVVSSSVLVAPNSAPTGTAAIKGLSTWGTMLSITSTIKDADGLGALSYTWQNDSGELSASSKYTLQQSDVGKQVWALVSYTDKKGNFEIVKSNVIDVTVSTKPSALNDILTGTDAADKLAGLAGNDTLIGGLGKDKLTGGVGADVFKFTSISDSSPLSKQADTITDFKHTQGDKIDLSAIDINPTLDGRQSFIPINAQTFSADATGQLRFDAKTSTLYGSTNSDSAPEFAIVLSGVKSLVAEDFIL